MLCKYSILKAAVKRLITKGAVESALPISFCERSVEVANFVYGMAEYESAVFTTSKLEYLLRIKHMTAKHERFFLDACIDRGLLVCKANNEPDAEYLFARPKAQIYIPAGE